MKLSLRVFYLEDDVRDAELVQDTLEANGIACQVRRVESKSDFLTALEEGGFEVILADCALSGFDRLTALKVAQQRLPDVPFIFVSGASVQDIAERKRAERRHLVQHRVTQILAEASTLEEATPQLLQDLCEGLAWDFGALWQAERQTGVLRCVASWRRASFEAPQFESATRAMTFQPGCGLPGSVWLNREPVYFSDFGRDANFPRTYMAAAEGLRAACAFPILLGGEVLGVTEFFSREMRPPDADLLNMMAAIDSQVGQFIERKRAEDALQQAQAELLHLTRVTTLGELTASIAHEVNQPLAGILTNANAGLRWLAGELPNLDETREAVNRIIRDGNRAREIIDRIRALARKAPPQKDWLDLNQTIWEITAMLRGELSRHRVSLQTQLANNLPALWGDRIQLQQVLLNLLMNGIEALSGVDEGPRELMVSSQKGTDISGGSAERASEMLAWLGAARRHVLVTVHDTGPGLDPQGQERLFEAFYTTKPHGLGLGLTICRSIIHGHGGRLRVRANPPRGAVFEFALPIRESGKLMMEAGTAKSSRGNRDLRESRGSASNA